LQHWFNLSDPGLEEALHDSVSMRKFAGIDLAEEAVPDETTACKFRHLLERHGLGERIFARVGELLQQRGFKLSAGTIVDATLIAAPTSTKNASGQRDPEMGTTKKGNQWHFGMKAHVGVDAKSKLIHSVVATPGNVPDGKVIKQLLHGRERNVWGDKAYVGLSRVIRARSPKAADLTLRPATSTRGLNPMQEHINQLRSQVRCRVEHVFAVIKCVFGFNKLRYRGLLKNSHRLMVSAALHNLYVVRHQLAL
jgi:IS5 family transposase